MERKKLTVKEARKLLRNLKGIESVIIGDHRIIRSGRGYATCRYREADPYADCRYLAGWGQGELLEHLLNGGEIVA